MTEKQYMKNLSVPEGRIDVVLDTDAFNEVDDQFAISYMLKSKEKLNVRAIYAAPFFNDLSSGPADGMEKSYKEIFHILDLAEEKVDAYRGSDRYLPDENTPVISPAAEDLVRRSADYSPERPLYVVAIGAITNVASALLMADHVKENTVVVWLGGNAHTFPHNGEFNMYQDVAAAKVVMGCGVPFVQLPCAGVVSAFTVSKPELEYWLVGKNPLSDYLAKNTIRSADGYAAGKPWTRVIWDVTAIAWLLNDGDRFMMSRIVDAPVPTYDSTYRFVPDSHPMRYVFYIERDVLMEDLIKKLTD